MPPQPEVCSRSNFNGNRADTDWWRAAARRQAPIREANRPVASDGPTFNCNVPPELRLVPRHSGYRNVIPRTVTSTMTTGVSTRNTTNV